MFARLVRVCDRQCKTPGVTSWISGRRLRRRGILNWQASNMGFSFTNVPKCNAGMRWLSINPPGKVAFGIVCRLAAKIANVYGSLAALAWLPERTKLQVERRRVL